jgi:TatA/E family protein of Tat protein translocase
VFNLGFTEMAVIFIVALLVFGPSKLPELARNLGKSLNEFRRASNDLRRSIMEADQPPPTPAPPQGPADEVAAAAPLPAPSALPPASSSLPIPAPPAASAPPTSAKPSEPTA